MYLEFLGFFRDRFFCILFVVLDFKVRKLEVRFRGGSSGCFYFRLGLVGGVCFFFFCISREMFKISYFLKGLEIGYSSFGMGNLILVFIIFLIVCRFFSVIFIIGRFVD